MEGCAVHYLSNRPVPITPSHDAVFSRCQSSFQSFFKMPDGKMHAHPRSFSAPPQRPLVFYTFDHQMVCYIGVEGGRC